MTRTEDKGNITWRMLWNNCWRLHQPWLQLPACKTALDLLAIPAAQISQVAVLLHGEGHKGQQHPRLQKSKPLFTPRHRGQRPLGRITVDCLLTCLLPGLGLGTVAEPVLFPHCTLLVLQPSRVHCKCGTRKVEKTEPLKRASVHRGTGGSLGYQGL